MKSKNIEEYYLETYCTVNNSLHLCVSGTLIPHVVCLPNVELRSSAKYVLLIEKDATFQRLLNENILDELKDSLLVTVLK